MSKKKNRWLKGAILLVAVAIVASSAALMVSGASHVTTEQTADETTVEAGETVNLTVTLDTPSDFNGPAVDVDLPENWSVVDQSATAGVTYRDSENQWLWLSGGEKTVDYTVEIPGNASNGTYQIVANGSATNGSTGDTVADENVTEITVGSPAPTNQLPTADFTIDPAEPTVGENVVLLGAASSDPDGSIVTYEWDLDGDGQYNDDTAIEQFTIFDSPGEKTVGLRVTDDDGGTDTARKNLTVVASANFSVSGLSAPASAVQGETIPVNATVSNVGGTAGSTDAEFVFGGDVLLNQSVELGAGNATDVSFDVPTGEVPPGTYEHGVQAGDSIQTANITIQQPATFEVSNLQAPASAVVGDTITVNATVSNVGGVAGTTDAEFVFAGGALLNQTVSIEAGSSTQVSFDVPLDNISAGTYEHGVRAGGDLATANLTVQEPAAFEVSGLSAPASAVQGENITINATVSNVGGVAGTTDAEFVFAGSALLTENVSLNAGSSTQVSFDVLLDNISAGTYEHGIRAGDSFPTANLTVQEPAEFEVSGLSAPTSAVQGETITVNATVSNVGDVQGSTTAEFVFAGGALLTENVSLNAGNSTQVSFDVPLDNISAGTYEHGIRAGGDLATANLTVEPLTTFEVTDLEAPATAVAGETITVNATVSNVGNATDTVDANFLFAGDALLTKSVTLGAGNSTPVSFEVPTEGVAPGTYEHGIEVGDSIQFANITIQQPATFEVSDLSAPGSAAQGETITVNATVSNVGDIAGTTDAEFVFAGGVLLTENVTLDAGSSTQVSFAVPLENISTDTYEHGVRVGDSFPTANITVQPPPAEFEVSNLDAPANAMTAGTITVNATVSNVGGTAGTTDAEFVFAGSVLLTENVTLDAGNSTQVSFEVPTAGLAGGNYTHGIRAGDSFQTAQIGINEVPTVSVSASPESPEVNQTVTLNATDSTDGDGNITSYEWDLDGDGQYDDATGPAVEVEYNASGERTIGLRVTDDDGLTNETSVTVDVRGGSDTISAEQPGFGVGVALIALLVVALVIRRFD